MCIRVRAHSVSHADATRFPTPMLLRHSCACRTTQGYLTGHDLRRARLNVFKHLAGKHDECKGNCSLAEDVEVTACGRGTCRARLAMPHTNTCTHIDTHTHAHACTYVHTHTHVCAHIHAYIYFFQLSPEYLSELSKIHDYTAARITVHTRCENM